MAKVLTENRCENVNSNIFLRVQTIENESDRSDSSSNESSSSTSDEDYCPTPPKEKKASITFLESLSQHIPLEEKHSDAKQFDKKKIFSRIQMKNENFLFKDIFFDRASKTKQKKKI